MNAEAIVIPGEAAPVEEQIKYLRDEVSRLRGKIKEEAKERQRHVEQSYKKLSDADAALRERIVALDERTVDLASGSTWRQIWGLLFVAAGSACMAVPSLLGLA